MDNFSPLRYPGGKNKTYQYVKYLVENNNIDTYIEPFCGGAAVALKLLLNNNVKRIMLNDFDRSIYAMWFSILHDTEAFIKRVREAEFTIEEWDKQQGIQKNKENADLLTLGFSTFYLNLECHCGFDTPSVSSKHVANRNSIHSFSWVVPSFSLCKYPT